MRLIGKISVRGPFGPQDNDKIMKILDSHPFNVELMSCLPFVQRGEKKIEPVKRLENVLFGCFMSSFMDEEDDESFVLPQQRQIPLMIEFCRLHMVFIIAFMDLRGYC